MKILVATDGSKPALHAVKYAVKLIGQLAPSDKHAVTLVSVHDDAGLRHARAYVGAEEISDYLREQSEKELKPARKILDAAGIRHDMDIRTGHIAREILASAKAAKVDMILMGAKGRSAIADLLIGSVAQRVLATAEVPVLLVK